MSAVRPFDRFEPDYEASLAQAGLRGFEDFWRLEWNWVEPRNERRSGWSGATRAQVQAGDRTLSLFVKRQENHCFRSLLHPLRGQPTFFREWRNIHRLRKGGVPTLDPVYYGERMQDGRYQAVLVTLALDTFQELDKVFAGRAALSGTQRSNILRVIAMVLLRFHRNGLRHNCLGGNHVMVRLDDKDRVDVRVLDLEKVKATRHPIGAAAHDLARFIRHTPTLIDEDHQALVNAYAQLLPQLMRKPLVQAVNQQLRAKHERRGRPAHPPIVLE